MVDIMSQKIAIVGLGYVGLPLAVEFGKIQTTVGFDIQQGRIDELGTGHDGTLEIDSQELKDATSLSFTSDENDLASCNIYIVTVPTPIDKYKTPDLTPLIKASEMIGRVISDGDIVIYESTVYPGATEEVCVPIIERLSGKTFNKDFTVGYSPERINPGDKQHRLPDIKKVTSGSTPETAEFVNNLYKTIITAGTHLAPTIRVAEAAKVIENIQRDVNIALINELALIFNKLDIDTLDVLEAAGTKWNFLPFRPGLVGGHCISVDPYYLTHKAQSVGYYPEIVLAGRRINDGMGYYIVNRLVREMIRNDIAVKGARILIMGLTFKENCPDLRNTRVIDIYSELKAFGAIVDVYDPWADPASALKEHDIELITPETGKYDAAVLAVNHREFLAGDEQSVLQYMRDNHVIFDVKGGLPRSERTMRL